MTTIELVRPRHAPVARTHPYLVEIRYKDGRSRSVRAKSYAAAKARLRTMLAEDPSWESSWIDEHQSARPIPVQLA